MDHLVCSTDQSLDDKIILGHQDLPPCAEEPWWPTPGWPWPRPLVDHRLMVMSWGCICFWLLCWAMMLHYARRWYFYLEHLIKILSIAGAIEVVRVYFFYHFWQYFHLSYLLANCQIHTKKRPSSSHSLALPAFSLQSLQLPFFYCHHHFMGSGGSPFQHELPCWY